MTGPQLRALRAAALAVLELWEENRRDPTAAAALDTRMKVEAGPRWHALLREAVSTRRYLWGLAMIEYGARRRRRK